MRERVHLAADEGSSEASRCCRDVNARLTSAIRTGTDTVTVILQLLAPKCAICWSTYAGLLNAGWLTLTTAKPHWLVFSLVSCLLAMSLSIRDAWRTRRVWPLVATVTAWLLFGAGWFTNEPSLRYAGFTVLLARTAMI